MIQILNICSLAIIAQIIEQIFFTGIADRKVPDQPLVFYNKEGVVCRFNLRKFGELPFHLVRSNRFPDLYKSVLFNYDWLHAKLSSCPLQAVLADFEDASVNVEEMEAKRELNLVADALRLGGAILQQYPDMLSSQLIGRLLPEIGGNPNIKMLLVACDTSGPKHSALIPMNHCLHTPGGPLKYSLEGHQFAVFGFCLTSDLRYMVSISTRFITWDLGTSDLTRDVNPGIEGIMQQLVTNSNPLPSEILMFSIFFPIRFSAVITNGPVHIRITTSVYC